MRSGQTQALCGRVQVPGDKSMSHRALMFGLLAAGETSITGLLEGEDVMRTAGAIRLLGGDAVRVGPGEWRVHGVGVGGLRSPGDVLYMGNSGTSARLLMGLAGGHPVTLTFTGDASLNRRPMARIVEPLSRMGVQFAGREGHRLPMTITGADPVMPIEYQLPVASAQTKSAILLAGLNSRGETTVIEPEPTRDHTEIMLRHMGAHITVEDIPGGGRRICLHGQPELRPTNFQVPGDPSSAAFLLVAALITPGSAVTVTNVGINPLRTGLLDCLREMGADLTVENQREQGGEITADITARAGPLRAITPPPERAPSMIDEYPILAIAAACAQGRTELRGLAELRVKESDRLAAIAAGLTACGVTVQELPDGLIIEGRGGEVRPIPGGATIATHMDHRIAMSFLVAGLAAERPVTVDDGATINTSFPGFRDLMNGLGAAIEDAG
ncbi:MAG: 3-phosphoshikimate 1-carboxyvinyltransferase [Alphaproteobacteria bacterium]|nr:3-phosphoshikimate 1-carboxyvinyltransferase [Alphaproteobacteria bacterium]